MKKIIRILFFVCLSFLMLSCDNDKKIRIYKGPYYEDFPEYYDNFIRYTLTENTKLLNSAIIVKVLNDSSNFINYRNINQVDTIPYLTLQSIEYYKDNIRDFLFYKYMIYSSKDYQGKMYQVEYPLELSGRKKMLILAFEHNFDTLANGAAYIQWSSKPMNIDDLKYNPDVAKPSYLWGINKLTDTITTNLSIKTLQQLYPDFEGVYIYKKYSEITIDHSYSSFDRSLFEHIEFVE